tara:strand:+ start:595 stop:696 length:102 start_codon:yes stop_codon:yes gene_type:complete
MEELLWQLDMIIEIFLKIALLGAVYKYITERRK